MQPLDGLDVSHGVVHRIVVMRRDPEPLPVLGPAEIDGEPGVVVADPPPGMAERVLTEGVPETVMDPLEVERRVVAPPTTFTAMTRSPTSTAPAVRVRANSSG